MDFPFCFHSNNAHPFFVFGQVMDFNFCFLLGNGLSFPFSGQVFEYFVSISVKCLTFFFSISVKCLTIFSLFQSSGWLSCLYFSQVLDYLVSILVKCLTWPRVALCVSSTLLTSTPTSQVYSTVQLFLKGLFHEIISLFISSNMFSSVLVLFRFYGAILYENQLNCLR